MYVRCIVSVLIFMLYCVCMTCASVYVLTVFVIFVNACALCLYDVCAYVCRCLFEYFVYDLLMCLIFECVYGWVDLFVNVLCMCVYDIACFVLMVVFDCWYVWFECLCCMNLYTSDVRFADDVFECVVHVFVLL